LLHNVGYLAQKRLARGVRLNYVEATALIANVVMEKARDGDSTVADLMSSARTMLGSNQVLPSVGSILHEVQIEATFPDGTKVGGLEQSDSRSITNFERSDGQTNM